MGSMANPGLMLAIGLGRKKDDSAPPSFRPKSGDSQDTTTVLGDDTASGAGIDPAEVDYSEDDLCGSCIHMGTDGECQKYGFPVTENGHCEAGYSPRGGGMAERSGEISPVVTTGQV